MGNDNALVSSLVFDSCRSGVSLPRLDGFDLMHADSGLVKWQSIPKILPLKANSKEEILH